MTQTKVGIGKSDPVNDIYKVLKDQILSLTIKPGELISENSLSAQMDASRTTVRAALAQLAEEGCIVVYPQKGTFVELIDFQRIKQAVFAHIVLEQAVIQEVCYQGFTDTQKELLTQALNELKSKTNKGNILDLLSVDYQLRYLLSTFCGKEGIWDFFRTIDCDILRIKYLQYDTFNYKVNMSSLTGWEHTQIEGRMLFDNLMRGDAEAAAMTCSNHFSSILWHAETLQRIYPQFFSE